MFELALTIAVGLILFYLILWGASVAMIAVAGLVVAVAQNWSAIWPFLVALGVFALFLTAKAVGAV